MSSTRSAISRATWASKNSCAAISWRKARAPRAEQLAVEQEALVAHRRSAVVAFGAGHASYHGGHADRRSRAWPWRRRAAAAIAAERSGTAASMLRPPCRSPSAAGLHLLPHARRQPRAALRRLLRQDRFHRASALRAARRSASLRGGRGAALGGGHRHAASLRPRAGRGALFGRPCASLSRASNIATGMRAGPVRALARQGGRRASRRRRSHRAGAALSRAAVVAALQPIGHARAWRWAAHRRPGRLLRAEAGAADGEPGRAHAPTSGAAMSPAPSRSTSARARIKGRKLVVVDDVITTGATAEACARALKRAGAARVDVLALARAVEPTAFVL